MYAVAILAEMAGLFAIWNWSRQFRSLAWMLLGSIILLSLAGALAWGAMAVGPRLYAACVGTYLASGLLWAWWREGLRPAEWRLGEWFVALAVAALCGVAISAS